MKNTEGFVSDWIKEVKLIITACNNDPLNEVKNDH